VNRPGYFRTMGVPLRAGRDFDERDAADAPGVVILNETLARRQWPTEDPIGKRVTIDDPRDNSRPLRWLTVVGVVKDVKQNSWTEPRANEISMPFQQGGGFYAGTAGHFTSMSVVVRTTVDPQTLATTAQETVRSINRNLPVSGVVSMEQVVSDA